MLFKSAYIGTAVVIWMASVCLAHLAIKKGISKKILDWIFISGLPLIVIAAFTPLSWTLANNIGKPTGHFPPISNNWLVVGTWLAGVLTPASLLVAFWGIRDQSETAREQIKTASAQIDLILKQIEVQQEANRISIAANFASMALKFNENLNLLAGKVMEDLSSNHNQLWENYRGVSALKIHLSQKASPGFPLYGIDQIRRARSYKRFCEELERTLTSAEKAESMGLISQWFLEIRELTLRNPPLG